MSGRVVTDAVRAALMSGQVCGPIHLLELDFEGGMFYASDAPFHMSYDINGDGIEEHFLGLGILGEISQMEESQELRAYGIAAKLSGLRPEVLAVALAENFQRRPARLWSAFLDPETERIIPDPLLGFEGMMDTMPIVFGSNASVTVNITERRVDWDRARISRYTDADQKGRYPGDKFFEKLNETTDKELLWGNS